MTVCGRKHTKRFAVMLHHIAVCSRHLVRPGDGLSSGLLKFHGSPASTVTRGEGLVTVRRRSSNPPPQAPRTIGTHFAERSALWPLRLTEYGERFAMRAVGISHQRTQSGLSELARAKSIPRGCYTGGVSVIDGMLQPKSVKRRQHHGRNECGEPRSIAGCSPVDRRIATTILTEGSLGGLY
jgi:hypothetical protein